MIKVIGKISELKAGTDFQRLSELCVVKCVQKQSLLRAGNQVVLIDMFFIIFKNAFDPPRFRKDKRLVVMRAVAQETPVRADRLPILHTVDLLFQFFRNGHIISSR